MVHRVRKFIPLLILGFFPTAVFGFQGPEKSKEAVIRARCIEIFRKIGSTKAEATSEAERERSKIDALCSELEKVSASELPGQIRLQLECYQVLRRIAKAEAAEIPTDDLVGAIESFRQWVNNASILDQLVRSTAAQLADAGRKSDAENLLEKFVTESMRQSKQSAILKDIIDVQGQKMYQVAYAYSQSTGGAGSGDGNVDDDAAKLVRVWLEKRLKRKLTDDEWASAWEHWSQGKVASDEILKTLSRK